MQLVGHLRAEGQPGDTDAYDVGTAGQCGDLCPHVARSKGNVATDWGGQRWRRGLNEAGGRSAMAWEILARSPPGRNAPICNRGNLQNPVHGRHSRGRSIADGQSVGDLLRHAWRSFHSPFFFAPRATIRSAPSGNGRCSLSASGADAVIEMSTSSGLVRMGVCAREGIWMDQNGSHRKTTSAGATVPPWAGRAPSGQAHDVWSAAGRSCEA